MNLTERKMVDAMESFLGGTIKENILPVYDTSVLDEVAEEIARTAISQAQSDTNGVKDNFKYVLDTIIDILGEERAKR